MTDDKMLQFRILTDGKLNGEKIYLRSSDIRRVAPIEIKSDSTFIVGTSTMVRGSILFMSATSGPPSQSVQETPEEVVEAIGGAVEVQNLSLRKNTEKKKALVA